VEGKKKLRERHKGAKARRHEGREKAKGWEQGGGKKELLAFIVGRFAA